MIWGCCVRARVLRWRSLRETGLICISYGRLDCFRDFRRGGGDSHRVERSPDEYQRRQQKQSCKKPSESVAMLPRQGNRKFYREQSEQGRELDNGIHGNRGRILEGIAYRIAYYGCVMKWCALLP